MVLGYFCALYFIHDSMALDFGLPDTHSIRQALALPTNGAQFRRCALQVNPYEYTVRYGPAQHGFTNEPDYNAALVAALVAAEVTVIAVTDHWKARTGTQLIAAAEAAGITVFPGFEASTSQGHHVLCLFNPGTPIEKLDLLAGQTHGSVGMVSDSVTGGIGVLTMDQLVELVQCPGKECPDWKGICIAAHVTNPSGILVAGGEVSSRAWQCRHLYAAAIPGPITDLPAGYLHIARNDVPEYRRDRLLALVNAGDVNGPADVTAPGKTCRIKLADLTVEGLRQAFLDPTPRIWLDGEQAPAAHMELVAAAWDGGPLDGLRLRFNSDLNVIIGGRGSGKSSILETLRYALDAPTLGADARTNHQQMVKHLLKNGGRVSVVVRRTNPTAAYLIERTYPDPPQVRDEAGDVLEVRPIDVLRQLPEFYGQHEIAELAKQKEDLTALLRRFLSAKAVAATDRKQATQRALAETRDRLLKLDQEIATADERLDKLSALEVRLAEFNRLGLPARLAANTHWQREGSLFDTARGRLAPLQHAVESLRTSVPLDRAALAPEALRTLPNAAMLGELFSILGTAEKAALQALTALETALASASTRIKEVQQQEWKPLRNAAEEALQKQLRELQEDKLDGSAYLELVKQVDQLQSLKNHRQALATTRDAERQRRLNVLAEYRDLLADERRELDRTAERVNQKLGRRVRARVTHQAQRDTLRELIREALAANNPGGQKYAPIIESLAKADNLSLTGLAESCRVRDLNALRTTYALTAGQAEQLAAIGPAACMRLEELDLPSETDLELNVAETGAPDAHWRSLKALSVGQRATAVLRLLLLSAELPAVAVPLLIDQPEDDLDNRFIADDIVPIIKEQKKVRQFVFATHNANVPVLGDADLIVGLKYADDHISIGTSGALETNDVHQLVEKVLEGGKEAFARRRAKYNF